MTTPQPYLDGVSGLTAFPSGRHPRRWVTLGDASTGAASVLEVDLIQVDQDFQFEMRVGTGPTLAMGAQVVLDAGARYYTGGAEFHSVYLRAHAIGADLAVCVCSYLAQNRDPLFYWGRVTVYQDVFAAVIRVSGSTISQTGPLVRLQNANLDDTWCASKYGPVTVNGQTGELHALDPSNGAVRGAVVRDLGFTEPMWVYQSTPHLPAHIFAVDSDTSGTYIWDLNTDGPAVTFGGEWVSPLSKDRGYLVVTDENWNRTASIQYWGPEGMVTGVATGDSGFTVGDIQMSLRSATEMVVSSSVFTSGYTDENSQVYDDYTDRYVGVLDLIDGGLVLTQPMTVVATVDHKPGGAT